AGFYLAGHHNRNIDFGAECDLGSVEPSGSDADNSEAVTVERDSLTDCRRIGRKTPLPASMTNDGDRVSIRSGIFVRGEGAAEPRFHAKDIEIIAGDKIAPDPAVLA